jgi:hypothetical protein
MEAKAGLMGLGGHVSVSKPDGFGGFIPRERSALLPNTYNLLYIAVVKIMQSQVCLMFLDEWSYIELIQRLDTSRYHGRRPIS